MTLKININNFCHFFNTQGVYTPVKGPYSNEFKKIVETMLDRDPTKRPSADELWTDIIPTVSQSQ